MYKGFMEYDIVDSFCTEVVGIFVGLEWEW